MTNSDIFDGDGVDVVTDTHRFDFESATFANIAGIDILHHFERPGPALRECTRVLKYEGRLVLVEPWSSSISGLFWRYGPHEGCWCIANPRDFAFSCDKHPMQGNAAIPKTIFSLKASAGSH